MKIFQILSVLALMTLPLQAMAAAPAPVTASKAYSFATPEGAKAAAVFMTLTYPAGSDIVPDRITKIETPVAGKAELHTMILDKNVMSMRALDSFPLPPTGTFSLKPDGVHVMMTDLKKGLKVGDHFPMTLTFEKAGSIPVDVTVRGPGDIEEPAEEKSVHENMDMDHGAMKQ